MVFVENTGSEYSSVAPVTTVVIPSNAKIGSVGTTIDVPIGHKDNSWSFDQIDTISVTIPGAPRSDEIVVILVLSDGGRPRPRISIVGG